MTRNSENVVSNLKNLLDLYNIGTVKKSMFGYFVDNLKFFYQLKSQEYKYIYDEVSARVIMLGDNMYNIEIFALSCICA